MAIGKLFFLRLMPLILAKCRVSFCLVPILDVRRTSAFLRGWMKKMENVVNKSVNILKFELGAVVMTRGVSELSEYGLNLLQYLRRHVSGDWGDIEEGDRLQNEESVMHGGRIFSAYNLSGMPESRLWVITEADRSVTTFLLPCEY